MPCPCDLWVLATVKLGYFTLAKNAQDLLLARDDYFAFFSMQEIW
jgi:hypothetical protein